jgi:hypothetical protein
MPPLRGVTEYSFALNMLSPGLKCFLPSYRSAQKSGAICFRLLLSEVVAEAAVAAAVLYPFFSHLSLTAFVAILDRSRRSGQS